MFERGRFYFWFLVFAACLMSVTSDDDAAWAILFTGAVVLAFLGERDVD